MILLVLILLSVDVDATWKHSSFCQSIREFTPQQVTLCKAQQPALLHAMYDGGQMALDECRQRFKYRRFNCSIAQGLHAPLPINFHLNDGTPEAAYVQAIRAAGMAWQFAIACENSKRLHLSGCGHKKLMVGKGQNHTKQLLSHPQATQRARRAVYRFVAADNYYAGAKRVMDTHNTAAALQVVGAHTHTKELCVDNKSCYRRSPSEFGDIADDIFRMYEKAIQAQPVLASERLVEQQSGRSLNREQLVYLVPSLTTAESCHRFPPRGRECMIDGGTGSLTCTQLCCGGANAPHEYTREEQCNCRGDHIAPVCDKCTVSVFVAAVCL